MYYTLYHEHRDSGDENYKRIDTWIKKWWSTWIKWMLL